MIHSIRIRENRHQERNIVKNHYHDVHQILYVLENKGEITLGDKKHKFSQDSLAFITPYSNHAISSTDKMTVLVLEFNLEKLDLDFKNTFDQYGMNETKLIQLNLFIAAEVKQLLRRMLYEQSQGETINQVAMGVYLSELLLILMRSQDEPYIPDANVLRAERLKKYIDTHYFEIVDANKLSQKLGISPRHMNAIFKEQYQVTPMQYLNEVRMEITKNMLMETNKDIATICFEVGFEAISTFYRRFKEYTNLSPNKFRLLYENHKVNE